MKITDLTLLNDGTTQVTLILKPSEELVITDGDTRYLMVFPTRDCPTPQLIVQSDNEPV